ncbi:MAG: hypothetical protein QOF47_1087 [Mycobacterium sp.]|jgi:hypothetical protein|nr:hypothetical protein [Mycobacterium sp.]
MAEHRAPRRPVVPGAPRLAVVLALVVGVALLSVQALTRAAPVGNSETSPPIRSQFLTLDQQADMSNQTRPVTTNLETTAAAPALAPIVPSMPAIAAPVWGQRGEIVSEESLSDLPSPLGDAVGEARRATYRSVSGISAAGTEVSGAFFVPKGSPPEGGWPVVSLAHSTTGMNTECGPSSQPDLFGFAPAVASLLSGGMAVAMTDYEGLGGPGLHPFLEPRTEGFNVIDAVRALRSLFPEVSARWLALGSSQGGQAAWAANEVNRSYGGGLKLLGSVALAPGANLTELAELAYNEQLSAKQLMVMPLIVMAVQRSFPDVPIDHLLHGDTLTARDVLIGCGPLSDEMRATVLTAADVKPASRADADALAHGLQKLALPREPVSAPLLVVSGSKDDLIFPSWVKTAVARSCRMGGQIEYLEQDGAGHADAGSDPRVMQWIADRLAGKAAPTSCAVT